MGRSSAREASLASVHTAAETQSGSRPLVLVVDDNPVNQKVSAAMLVKLGYRADIAGDGVEAVSATAKHQYAAVLMDCLLPGMDGFQATAAIRLREGSGRHTPIIAMTASAMKGDQERCIAAGMDAYVSKPVKMRQLGEIIATWVESSERQGAPGPDLNGQALDLAPVSRLGEDPVAEVLTHQGERSS